MFILFKGDLMEGFERYKYYWGNFKSDKYKSKKTLKTEIRDILYLGTYSRNRLIKLKEITKEFGGFPE
jgi:hypothetical protein